MLPQNIREKKGGRTLMNQTGKEKKDRETSKKVSKGKKLCS